nr:HNH endonuclease signature motif containing protein [Propionicimonas sp.]
MAGQGFVGVYDFSQETLIPQAWFRGCSARKVSVLASSVVAMDEDTTITTRVVVDPCPNGHLELLEAIGHRLDQWPEEPWPEEPVEPWQFTDKALLADLVATQRQLSRLQGRWLGLLAEAEKREATLKQAGLSTAAWLVDRNTHSVRAAREEVRLAVGLDAQPVVADALGTGGLSAEQARTITTGLGRLPEDLDAGQRAAVAAHLVGLGGEFGPYGLGRLVNRAVEVVAPQVAEDADRKAVERMEAAQHRGRFLTWHTDPDDGSLLLHGKLPAVAGQQLVGLVKALGAKNRKTAALAGEQLSRGQAHADALIQLAQHYAGCRKPPRLGADRPRLLVTIDYDTLCGRLGTATLLNTGEQPSARQARLLACDAQVLPMVMGGRGMPLDAGREKRLFTGPLRALLIARDQGCAFPGCDVGPAECEAHHRQPWWAGGRTSLDNGVLQCAYHHHVVEPVPGAPPETQWAIRMDPNGHPEFAAPQGIGASPGQRRWRQHHRYRT